MQRLTLYILKQLAMGTALVAGGLLCILWLTQSLRFIELIATEGLSISTFLRLTGLLLPSFLVVILPIAVFAVVLFTYNRLNTDRELVVMRAAGIGPFGLAKPALILGLALVLLGYVFALWIGPASVSAFKELQWSVRNDVSRLLIQEGAFNTLSRGLTVYVRERADNGELRGILVHDTRGEDRVVTLTAEKGAMIKGELGPAVLLANGSRQEVTRATKTLSLLHFETYTMDIGSRGEAPGARTPEVSERPTLELLLSAPDEAAGVSSAAVRRFRVEAHQRLLQPLFNLSFPLVALSFLFSGAFNRRGSSDRVISSVAVIVALEAGFLGLSNAAAGNLSFLPLMYGITFLPLVLAAVVLTCPSVFRSFRSTLIRPALKPNPS